MFFPANLPLLPAFSYQVAQEYERKISEAFSHHCLPNVYVGSNKPGPESLCNVEMGWVGGGITEKANSGFGCGAQDASAFGETERESKRERNSTHEQF